MLTLIPIVSGTVRKILKNVKGAGRFRNLMTKKYLPNDCIVKIWQNTERSPEDLSWIDVIQSPMKD